MTSIVINDLTTQNLLTEVDTIELNEVKGGCPVCIVLIGIAAGYAFDRWVNS